MSNKKNSFFSKLKNKIRGNRDEDLYQEYDEEFEDQDQSEYLDRTDEINVGALKEQLDNYQLDEEDELDDSSSLHEYNEFEMPKQKESRIASLMSFFNKKKTSSPKSGQKTKTSFFSWDGLINKIFSPDSRPTIHRIFLASLFCVFTFVLGKTTALYLQGISSKKTKKSLAPPPSLASSPNYRKDMAEINKANLFNAREDKVAVAKPTPKPTPKPPEIKVCHKSNKSSTLPIKLIGTLVLQDSVKSLAAVQIRGKKKLMNIREGEKVDNIAEIGRIADQQIIFKNLKTGRCEYMRSSKKKPIKSPRKAVGLVSKKKAKQIIKDQRKDNRIKNEGNKFKIKKSLRDEMLGNIGEVLTQARAIPIKNPDGSMSFKVTEIVPNSIYSKLNIQNGDIINSINGKKIQNVNEVMSMFGKIKEFDNFQLSILRNGAEENLEYNFE